MLLQLSVERPSAMVHFHNWLGMYVPMNVDVTPFQNMTNQLCAWTMTLGFSTDNCSSAPRQHHVLYMDPDSVSHTVSIH